VGNSIVGREGVIVPGATVVTLSRVLAQRILPRWGAGCVVAAALILVSAPTAQAACSATRVTSLPDLASEVGAGNSACLADGTYAGNVELSNPTTNTAVVTQEGAAVIIGQVRLSSSHLRLDGLRVRNLAGIGGWADCVRVQTIGGTDIGVVNSDVGPCARDVVRMSYNQGQHDTGVTIQANHLHDAVWNACTCYMRGGLFGDNLVENISNDALDLWGDSNVVRHNVFRNLIANPPTNHKDVLQTWQVADAPATGDPLTNLLFNRNVIDTVAGPDSHGLMINGGSANSGLNIRSNLFRDIGSIGALFAATANVTVFANTFAHAGSNDTIEWKRGATGTMDSNIFYDAASAGSEPWYQDATSNPRRTNNLAWGGQLLASDASGQNADPRFQDPDGALDGDRSDDFWLSPGSPAIDHGNPSVTNRIDIIGRPIMNFGLDQGAYEAAR